MNHCAKKNVECSNSVLAIGLPNALASHDQNLKKSKVVLRHSSVPSLCSTFLTESSMGSGFLMDDSQDFQASAKQFIFEESLKDMKDWIIDQGNDFETPEDFMKSYVELLRSKFEIPVDRFYVGHLAPVEDSAYSFKWETSDSHVERKVIRNMSRRHSLYGSDAPFNILQEKRADSIRIRATDPHIPSDCQWFREGGYTDYFCLPILCKNEVLGGTTWSTKSPLGFSVDQIDMFQRSSRALTMNIRNLMHEQIVHDLVQHPKEETSEKKCCKTMENMAMISHELRTPLNGIISMAQLIQDDDNLDESQKESLQVITQSGQFLMSIINDVLDFSKLQALQKEDGKRMNKDMFVIQPLRLRDILNGVVHTMRIQCRERHLHLYISYMGQAEDPDMIVHTDGNRLQQILYNLLGNAVKFSKEGGTIELQVSATDDSLRFVIKDYGDGIRKENLFSIFEPYSQVKSANHNAHGGTGLGLTLTKLLTTCLGGTLTADSVYGEWTEFTVNLPLQPSSSSDDSGTTPVDASIRRTLSGQVSKDDVYPNLRVLVADDNTINQKVLLRMLQQLNVGNVDIVSSGIEAVRKATSQSYDVILMDVEMPVMNGISAMKEILSTQHNSSLKTPDCVFATAHRSLDYYKDEMSDLSCSHYFISKPFYVQQIDDLLYEIVCCRSSATF